MAVSQIEEKILGRLARQAGPSNPLLSASLYQVLGLSILLSRKLHKARRVRRLDVTRDTRSLQLYHHIIWLAREGLALTEVYVLPYCQAGEQGRECRVMATKLRASFHHVFCLFHNHPPISSLSPRAPEPRSPPSSGRTPKTAEPGATRRSPGRSPRSGREAGGDKRRRAGANAGLRDPIPSLLSEASYITNPYSGPAQTPPPPGPPPPIPTEARRTPTRPPGLPALNLSPAAQRASASFLLPPLNFVPVTEEHFATAQHLANALLPPAHALRLAISLEHAAFQWECGKRADRAVQLAGAAVRTVYESTEGLDDEEFADAAALVQNLAAILKRGKLEEARGEGAATSRGGGLPATPPQPASRAPRIDRAIAVSPPTARAASAASSSLDDRGSLLRSPERLSTVPEDASAEAATSASSRHTPAVLDPPISRLSSRSRSGLPPRGSPSPSPPTTTTTGDKAAKRRAAEQLAEDVRRRGSRLPRPVEEGSMDTSPPVVTRDARTRPRTSGEERREAVRTALRILSSVSEGLYHGTRTEAWRMV
ncbi:hypothetical protein LTR53_007727 [Teratosphaeriaceae sp. CCFEE 6253]|nr:hypothetical protein LTR53_007727 [Teratosphaeriaceae sp. CCFEE 6253]